MRIYKLMPIIILLMAIIAFAAPSVTLASPSNFYNSSSPVITFSCMVFDNTSITDTSLFGNWGNAWHNAVTNKTAVNSAQMNFTINITRDLQNQTDGLNLQALFGWGAIQGVTTIDGSTFWIIDSSNRSVLHINKTGGVIAFYDTRSILSSGIRGITTNGTDFWIVNQNPDVVLHYSYTFSYLDNFSTSAFGSQNPSDITTVDGSEFWIIDSQNDTVFRVNNVGTKIAEYSISTILNSHGIDTIDGTEFWILDQHASVGIPTKSIYYLNSTFGIIDRINITKVLPGISGTIGGLTMTDELNFWISDGFQNSLIHFAATKDGTYDWTCQAVSANGATFADNRTISVSTAPPGNIVFGPETPENNSYTLNDYVFVNVTFEETNPDTCWLEWNNGSLNNIIMTRIGNNCFHNVTIQPNGEWNYTVYVNDSSGSTGSSGLMFIKILALPNLSAGEITGRPGSTFITVNAVNGDKTGSFYVEYGTSSAEPGGYPANSTIMRNLENDTIFEVNLTDLTENTTYYYRLRGNDSADTTFGASEERSFVTRRPPGTAFTFSLFSDSHLEYDNESQYSIAYNITKNIELQNPDFVLALGDNIQHPFTGSVNSAPATNLTDAILIYRKFRAVVENLRSPLFSVIGNWEGELGWDEASTNLTRPVRMDYLPNPDSTTYGEGGSIHENYYAFNWSDALFVVLDVQTYTTNKSVMFGLVGSKNWTLGEEQLNWFNTTMRNSNKKWKFVIIHHTVGGKGFDVANSDYGRGGGRAARVGEQSSVHQIMIENGVDAFFYGHDHAFVDMRVDGVYYTAIGRSGHYWTFLVKGGYYTDPNVTGYYVYNGHATVYVDPDNVNISWYNSTSYANYNLIYSYVIDGQAPNASLYHQDIVESGTPLVIDCDVRDNTDDESNITKTLTIIKPSGESMPFTCGTAFDQTSEVGNYTLKLNATDSRMNSVEITSTFTSEESLACYEGLQNGQCVDEGNSPYYCSNGSVISNCILCGGCINGFTCQTNPNAWNYGACYRTENRLPALYSEPTL